MADHSQESAATTYTQVVTLSIRALAIIDPGLHNHA